jgi:hypothetical protein
MNGTISLQSQKGVGSTFSFVALTRRTNNIPPDYPGRSSVIPIPVSLTTMLTKHGIVVSLVYSVKRYEMLKMRCDEKGEK